MPTLLKDLRYAIRQLRKSPGFAFTAILTLALGVGANVVVFSVLNALILKPLNVPQSQSLYNVVHRSSGYDSQSYPDFLDLRSRNTSFTDMTAYRMNDAALRTGNSAEKFWDYEVSGNYFDMLGVRPALGRLFHASDEHGPNSAPYIVLSYNFWQRHFNGNPHIVGMKVDLNKNPFTVIGVAPRDFHGTELFMWPEFWVPMVNEQQVEGFNFLNQRSDHGIWVLGRLKPGTTLQQATNNLNAVASQLAKQFPVADDGLNARLVKPGLLGDQLGPPVRGFMARIMALALLVLLAACANLGSIFAARAADRSRELAIRLAVGSTRGRILGQLLTESVAVSIMGGVAGTFFATGLLRVLSRWHPYAEFPIHVTVLPDWRVYTVALLLCLGSGILFGLLPARQIWRTDAAQVMKSGASTIAIARRYC